MTDKVEDSKVLEPVEPLASSTNTIRCTCGHKAVHHINYKGLCTGESCNCMRLNPK